MSMDEKINWHVGNTPLFFKDLPQVEPNNVLIGIGLASQCKVR